MTATETNASGRQVHLRTCPLCEAMCGLEVHVRDERVELILAILRGANVGGVNVEAPCREPGVEMVAGHSFVPCLR